jgi:hypothetical protein
LHNSSFEGKTIRVTVCGKRFKRQGQQQQQQQQAEAQRATPKPVPPELREPAAKKAKGYDYEVGAREFEGKRATQEPTGYDCVFHAALAFILNSLFTPAPSLCWSSYFSEHNGVCTLENA